MKYFTLFLIALITTFAIEPQQSPDMTLIKGGTFMMGSTDGQTDELPVHQVTVNSFYMGKKEITVAEWKIFIKAIGKSMPEKTTWPLLDNYPMVYIGWVDAIEYCNWLSVKNKLAPCYKIVKSGNSTQITCNFQVDGYRLPTEAEWEYAARGGSLSHNYVFSGSNDINLVAYYGYNSDNKPHPVGELRPNELGLYDMSGNAWEWCWDYYNSRYYSNSPKSNPIGPDKGIFRVLRGGCLLRNAASCRVASRYNAQWQNFRGNSNGFRLCRNAK